MSSRASAIRMPRPWEPWQSWHKLWCGLTRRHKNKSIWHRICAGGSKDIRWCKRCGKLETRPHEPDVK